MERKSVREFIDYELLHGGHTNLREYCIMLGYVPVTMPHLLGYERDAVLHWLEQHFGYERYNWLGKTFWFNSPEDATLFVLSLPADTATWLSNQQTV